ncbi:siderophore-interacting protein [Paracoccus aminovorans]|uniref:siderophore-interacting protein n=1 Tax=Paracoccus aminovorans TaxID=34004 RepID=UPI000782CBD2|nr:siderophore-interacting protein [Paracoccus aminovorans]
MFPIRPYRSIGTLGPASGAVAAALKARAAAWELELVETPDSLTLLVWGCAMTLFTDGHGARLELDAPEKRLIGTLQDTAATLLDELGVTVDWDRVDAGALAPGLALMRVVSVASRTPGFIRVRLAGEEAGRFGTGALHFRLLLPPEGRAPQWPRVAPNGRTVWPEGADAPHRAVYTTAAQQDDWLEFDIFRHAGSPTCDWADRARPGDPVGIIGPGGGGIPNAARLWLFGDETALPAIARILTEAPGRVSASLCCRPEDMGALAQDPRVTRCDDLLAALDAADLAGAPDRHIWFAGPAEAARAARQRLLARACDKREFIAAAYWG